MPEVEKPLVFRLGNWKWFPSMLGIDSLAIVSCIFAGVITLPVLFWLNSNFSPAFDLQNSPPPISSPVPSTVPTEKKFDFKIQHMAEGQKQTTPKEDLVVALASSRGTLAGGVFPRYPDSWSEEQIRNFEREQKKKEQRKKASQASEVI